ncbi:MAG: helix-hairpin-helix domain-containing protein [Bacteroidales bacterium]|nr:helix-hairpin-helix domain-containing protein [Bacteroidales bacterium]
MDTDKKKSSKFSASAAMGAVALAFLVIGYQTALFVHRAAALRIVANKDSPDTVYIIERVHDSPLESSGEQTEVITRRSNSHHSPKAVNIRREYTARSYESFRFNPNTASVEDLMRLGFSRKQAESIDNYRRKGGRFRRKSDFKKSYVVEDSVFARLEPFIDIPLVDLNKADSADFDALPGIGPWFASKMISYRRSLGGYSFKEQLMDIYNFDKDKFDGLKDLVTVGPGAPFRLWTLPEDSLRMHPYIDRHAAHSIVLFRDNTPPEGCTVEALAKAGILPEELALKLARCRIEPPAPTRANK